MTIEISSTDVADAEVFLASLLEQNVENGRFDQGTALRDLTVKAFAFITAYFRQQNNEVRSLQNLLNIQNIGSSTDPNTDRAISAATDALLSNWFINRKVGGFARGTVSVVVTKKQDYLVPATARFSYTRSQIFFPDVSDVTQPILVSANDVFPITTSSGQVVNYFFNLRLVSARTGTDFNVDPAQWLDFTRFSPNAVSVSNSTAFSGGRAQETTAELIARSKNAIAVRNLINNRSIDATLKETFSELRRLLVVGYGEPEMQRDFKVELGTGAQLHVGGHYDIYLDLPLTESRTTGTVGGRFLRTDGVVNIFRDTSVADWTTGPVRIGDVIRVVSGLDDVPVDRTIKQIFPGELRVGTDTPFSEATDELGTNVTYFIYRPLFGPDWQVYPTIGVSTTGQTSRQISVSGTILLPGEPHYDILEVSVIDPSPGDPFADPATNTVNFVTRVNTTPAPLGTSSTNEYQVVCNDPLNSQSSRGFDQVVVDPAYDGKTLRVVYQTLAGYSAVESFVQDRFERVLAANPLSRGYFPVYLTFTVPYKLKSQADNIVDELALRTALVEFINSFDPNDVIDVSDITAFSRTFDTNIGTIFAFDIGYDLIVPDGRVITYSTPDVVSIEPQYLIPEFVGAFPNSLGQSVSDRTVRYITTLDRVQVERRV